MNKPLILTGLVVAFIITHIFICSPYAAYAASDPFKSDEELMNDALKEIKNDLIAKLKEKGHEKLAGMLSGMNPEKIGDFLGSAAGGDFDKSFEIAGSSAANYLADKFKEKLSGKFDEIVQPGSPAAEMIKYIPWNAEDGKQIAIEILNGNLSAAKQKMTSMVKKEGRANLETLSKDLITKGIDWVLKPTTGGSPGALFIKVVEWEMAAIEVFKKWSSNYFGEDVHEDYNSFRKRGDSPDEAIANLLEKGHKLTYPFSGADATKVLESHYLNNTEQGRALLERLRQQQEQELNKVTDLIKQTLQAERSYLLKIILDVAKNNQQVKDLIGKIKAVREKIKSLEGKTENLTKFWKSSKNLIGAAKIKKLKEGLEKKAAEFEKGAQPGKFERCTKIDTWTEQIENNQDQIDALLDKIREIGLKTKKIVKKICENKDDKELGKKGLIAVKKRIGVVTPKTSEIKRLKKEALVSIAQLTSLKNDMRKVLQSLKSADQLLGKTEKLKEDLTTVQKGIKAETKGSEKLYADIQKIMNHPIFNGFKGKAGSIRYELLGDARDAKAEFDTKKSDIESELIQIDSDLNALDAVNEKLTRQKERLQEAIGNCKNLENIEPRQLQDSLNQQSKKLNGYKNAFDKLLRKAKECAGIDDDEESSDSMREANKLLGRAQQAGGKLLDSYIVLDGAKGAIATTLSLLNTAKGELALATIGLNGLLEACQQAKTLGKKRLAEIRAAIVASAADIAKLKKNFETAANKRKEACEFYKQALQEDNDEQCTQLAEQSKASAATARSAAGSAQRLAAAIKVRYTTLANQSDVAALDTILRRIPSKIVAIDKALAKAKEILSIASPEAVARILKTAEGAATDVQIQKGIVIRLVGQVRGLLMSISKNKAKEAQSILKSAQNFEEIANRRGEQAGKDLLEVKRIGTQYSTVRKAIDSQMALLKSAKAKLSDCKTQDGGMDLNDLRAYSDTGEIFGPYSETNAEGAESCAQLAASACASGEKSGATGDQDGDQDEENPFENDQAGEAFVALTSEENQEPDSGYPPYGQGSTGAEGESQTRLTAVLGETQERLEDGMGRRRVTSVRTAGSERGGTGSTGGSQSAEDGTGGYYIVKEYRKFYERYAKCTSTHFNVLGPMTAKQFNKELSKRQKNAKTKARAWQKSPQYGRQNSYAITVTKAGKYNTKPTAPKDGVKCTKCPAGQHIGLSPHKRCCHPECPRSEDGTPQDYICGRGCMPVGKAK
jgi:hypothetical protein